MASKLTASIPPYAAASRAVTPSQHAVWTPPEPRSPRIYWQKQADKKPTSGTDYVNESVWTSNAALAVAVRKPRKQGSSYANSVTLDSCFILTKNTCGPTVQPHLRAFAITTEHPRNSAPPLLFQNRSAAPSLTVPNILPLCRRKPLRKHARTLYGCLWVGK